ncbi:MAG: ADYC domain-containing protein, partial [Myxococcota bacterium]
MFKARYAFALTAITALATSAGCALDTEALGTDGHFLLEAGGNDDGTDGCPWDMCGGNFDIALGFAISTNGQPNHYGLSVVSVRMPGGAPGWLTISGSELAIWFNGQLATGDNVVGAELVLESEVTGGRFILQVVDWNADGVESWAFPGEYYSTYSFIWRHQGAPMSASLPLCGANPWAGPTSSAAPSTEAVILPHESYDWEGNPTNDLANDPLQGENWLSIACSGGALAKKKLMGYDLSFTAPGRVTTRGESHAVLAMLNARFC